MDQGWKDILEKFRIKPPSTDTVLFSGLILLFVIISTVVYKIIKNIQRRQKESRLQWSRFAETGKKHDLSQNELQLLKKMVSKLIPNEPNKLWDSVVAYDKLVDGFYDAQKNSDENIPESYAQIFGSIREKCFISKAESLGQITSTREIVIGENIKIAIPFEGTGRFVNAKVAMNTKEGVVLHSKWFDEIPNVFSKGEVYDVYYWRKGYVDYEFPLVVKKQIDRESILFNHADSMQAHEKRNYYRIDTTLTGKFYKLNAREREEFWKTDTFIRKKHPGNFLGLVRSVSGGGISFITENPTISVDDLVWIEILLDKEKKFSDIVGRVIGLKKLEDKFKIFVEFVMLSEKSRESIVKYVSLIQRENES